MSSVSHDSESFTVTDAVAGLMAGGSLVLSIIACGFGLLLEVDPRPAVTAPVAALVALVAARMSARFQRLAFIAVVVAMIAWVIGMSLAAVTENPII